MWYHKRQGQREFQKESKSALSNALQSMNKNSATAFNEDKKKTLVIFKIGLILNTQFYEL